MIFLSLKNDMGGGVKGAWRWFILVSVSPFIFSLLWNWPPYLTNRVSREQVQFGYVSQSLWALILLGAFKLRVCDWTARGEKMKWKEKAIEWCDRVLHFALTLLVCMNWSRAKFVSLCICTYSIVWHTLCDRFCFSGSSSALFMI